VMVSLKGLLLGTTALDKDNAEIEVSPASHYL
jgi:hypothetical protein